ncbi:hypothetical protein C8J55DRAFT_493448 [Lentinula edodes]|uniref:Uncharacterized protein n=1 Tax=Lentinula lateritia TaxID=40482 RepID=A0A9W8ZTU6_9AGAR|nr:hypothetical protein C8J55DRAFT_493448 [Lentinula edodes]
MVLSRIIVTALLAFGSITVALPVVPGDVTGTTPTPGSGSPLPHLQGSLVGDGVPLQDGMKGVSPPVGGLSPPHGNEAGGSITWRQGSSAARSSSNVRPPERRRYHPSSSEYPLEECNKESLTLDYDKEIQQDIALVKNFRNLHKRYKGIADRLSAHLDELSSFNIKPNPNVEDDCRSIALLRAIIHFVSFSAPYKGKDRKIEKLREAFQQGESPKKLRAILDGSSEPGIH